MTLAAALAAFRDRRGHFPGCGHRCWLNGYDNRRRHRPGIDCNSLACDGEGIGCSAKCRAASRALAEAAG